MNIIVRRLAAFSIDAAIVAASAFLLEPSAAAATNPLIAYPVASLPAIGLLGTWTGRFGSTPGKRLLGLKVVFQAGGPVGMGRGLSREAIRFLSLPVFVLPILYLATLAAKGKPPYDEFLGLQVEDR